MHVDLTNLLGCRSSILGVSNCALQHEPCALPARRSAHSDVFGLRLIKCAAAHGFEKEFWNVGCLRLRHFVRVSANLTTLVHFSVSRVMNLPNSAGELNIVA